MLLALASVALPQPHLPLVFCCKPPVAHVRFTAGDGGQPLAGALVRVYAVPPGFSQWTDDARFDPVAWGLKRVEAPRTSDEHGLLDLPMSDQELLLEASGEGRWSAIFVQPSTDACTPQEHVWDLPLRPDFDVRARVVDEKGAPLAGIPLVLREHSQFNGEEQASEECLSLTDADGRAVLPHAGAAMPLEPAEWKRRYAVANANCNWPPVEAEIDPKHPPDGEVVLRMPPTGEVELVYEEPDGTPIPIEGDCALVPGHAWSRSFPPFRLWTRQPYAEVVEHPRTNSVVFRRVGLDVELGAWAQRNAISATACAGLRGPKASGERVRVVIHPPAVAHVRGRFVDERGEPRSNVRFIVILRRTPPGGRWPEPPYDKNGFRTFSGPPEPQGMVEEELGARLIFSSAAEVETDARGCFAFDLENNCFGGDESSIVFIEHRGAVDERSATVRHVLPGNECVMDLGALALAASPLVVSGVAVDEAGKPLARLTVQGSSYEMGGMNRFRFTTATSADGSFVLRGPCPEEFTDLVFGDFEWVTEFHVVKLGTTDSRFVLRRRVPDVGGK